MTDGGGELDMSGLDGVGDQDQGMTDGWTALAVSLKYVCGIRVGGVECMELPADFPADGFSAQVTGATPLQPPTGFLAKELSAEDQAVCATGERDGVDAIYCWRFRDGVELASLQADKVLLDDGDEWDPDVDSILHITSGPNRTCAVWEPVESKPRLPLIQCWNATGATNSIRATTLVGSQEAVALAVSGRRTCWSRNTEAGSEIWCKDTDGDGETSDVVTSESFRLLEGEEIEFGELIAGQAHLCLVSESFKVFCRDEASDCDLVRGHNSADGFAPAQPHGSQVYGHEMSADRNYSCALDSMGLLECWGTFGEVCDRSLRIVEEVSGAAALTIKNRVLCYLMEATEVRCMQPSPSKN